MLESLDEGKVVVNGRLHAMVALLLSLSLTLASFAETFSAEPLFRANGFFVGMSLAEAKAILPEIDPKPDGDKLETWSNGELSLYFQGSSVIRVIGNQVVIDGFQLQPSLNEEQCLEKLRELEKDGAISTWNLASDDYGGALISVWTSTEELELYFRNNKFSYGTLGLRR